MKYKIALLIILFPAFLQAQNRHFLDSCVEEIKLKLIDTWALGIDSNSNSVDLKTYNKFKSLFDSDAVIDDDLNYGFAPLSESSGTYKKIAIPKAFDVYAHDAALEISKLRIDSIHMDQAVWKNDTCTITISRKISADKARRYLFKDTAALATSLINTRPNIQFESKRKQLADSTKMAENLKNMIWKNPDSTYRFEYTSTSLITLIYNGDDKINPVKIKSIKDVSISNDSISCLNDADRDGILDGEDSLKNKYGDFTSNGRPDYDFDKVPDFSKDATDIIDLCKDTYADTTDNHGCPATYFITKRAFEGFAGLQFNAGKINLPALNQLGYADAAGNNATDVLQSKKGILTNPGMVAGVYGGGSFSYYFGKKRKKTGISAGISYARFNADYQLTDPIVYTYKAFDGTNFYRRQIEITKLKEDIIYSIVNIPVMFSYRQKIPGSNPKKQWVINVKTGPSLMFFKTTSQYDAAINIGGLYQVDTVSKNKITYYDYFTPGSTYNVNFTASGINSQNPNPGAGSIFSQLYSNSPAYDFASKQLTGKQLLTRKTIALNLYIDGQRTIAEGMSIKVGASFVYAPFLQVKEKYKPIDNTTDAYKSIYNSNGKSNYYSVGINVGFVYNW